MPLLRWRNGLSRSAQSLALGPRSATLGETHRVRRQSQLEVDISKLLGVLSLPGRASGAVENFTVNFIRRE